MIAPMEQMANLIGSIGNNGFELDFYNFCHELLQVDHCTVFSFDQHGTPQCLVAEARHSHSREVARQLAQEYTEGAYRRDPNVGTQQVCAPPSNSPIVRCVTPSHIRDLGYRRRFYDEALVRQELAMITTVNQQTLYFSFYRGENQNDFVSEDALQIQQLSGLLAQTLSKHAQIMQMRENMAGRTPEPATLSPERRERMFHELRASLLKAPGSLTQREAEICASIALGYTTLGISLKLGISINTVATHRKRAYSKLGISCQNELFARYFDSVGSSAIN
ncbi:helix-turn-helix transcriptional regulator [Pseudomonas sp. LRF_L74]|uniref:helix-turn-helix transcriptional regulator n=1 Tax=Pseudomonas sp. LRF_L74 TaxID=3369422 RepID=UPI003F63C790